LIAGSQQHHSEFISLELDIEFLGQVLGMPRITERNLFVFGPRILYQQIRCFEINGFVVVKYCPYTFAGQYLLGLVGGLVGVLD
jgi:hypothetical protein